MFSDHEKEMFFQASLGVGEGIAKTFLKEQHYDLSLAMWHYMDSLRGQMYLMSGVVSSTISDLESIARGDPQNYADTVKNQLEKGYWSKRPMTMKDVKPIAKRNADALRKVWDFLDPVGQ